VLCKHANRVDLGTLGPNSAYFEGRYLPRRHSTPQKVHHLDRIHRNGGDERVEAPRNLTELNLRLRKSPLSERLVHYSRRLWKNLPGFATAVSEGKGLPFSWYPASYLRPGELNHLHRNRGQLEHLNSRLPKDPEEPNSPTIREPLP